MPGTVSPAHYLGITLWSIIFVGIQYQTYTLIHGLWPVLVSLLMIGRHPAWQGFGERTCSLRVSYETRQLYIAQSCV